jgi:hypothetical protein
MEEISVQNEGSMTIGSLPVSQPAITRYSSNGPKPFGTQSRLFYHDPTTQQPQPETAELRSGKSDKASKYKHGSFGKRSFNPGRKPERNDAPMPTMDSDTESDLGSFSLEQEIRHHRYG